MTPYNKTINRMLASNIIRLLVISLIIAIGISVITGIATFPYQMREAIKQEGVSIENIQLIAILADRVEILGNVLPQFFLIVAMLCVLITMTRLINEERATIACLKTLGYSSFVITLRYFIFGFITLCIGCTIGVIVGNFALRPLFFETLTQRFDVPNISMPILINEGILYSFVMSGFLFLAITISCIRAMKEQPASLLRPKILKSGGKFFLEYIPAIWRWFPFRYKSTLRNIWRYKIRMILTIVTVAGGTIILFAGLGILLSIGDYNSDSVMNFSSFVESFQIIALILTIFAVVLIVLILFNLTNINIEERRREIATLKVLGYTKIETSGFIFREILILSTMGIAIGLLAGYYFLDFLFELIEFGDISLVQWFVWFITAAVAFVSVFFTDILLYRKINKIDMTTSLKAVE